MSIARRISDSPFLAPTWIWIAVNLFAGGMVGFNALTWMPRVLWPIAIGAVMALASVLDQRATIRAFEGGQRLWHEVPSGVRWFFMLRLFLLRALIICAVGVAASLISGYFFGINAPARG